MKVVINQCFGGFSLSHKAVMRYAEIKNIQLYPFTSHYRGKKSIYTLWDGIGETPFIIHYLTTMTPELDINNHYFSDRDIPRDDPVLVQVVEELKEEADGSCARLGIVEIPDDIQWEVEEYDGSEHISEVHQTWG
jgi:hypothetical protein